MPNNVCVILPGSPTAQPYAIQQGKALAMTVIDLFCDPQLRQEMKKQFKKDSTYEHYSQNTGLINEVPNLQLRTCIVHDATSGKHKL